MPIKGTPNFERRIKDMKVGEAGYALPWALEFDREGIPYLNLDMPVQNSAGGTFALPIRRIDVGRTDYEVDLNFPYSGDKYKWPVSAIPFSGLVGVQRLNIARLGNDDDSEESKLENAVQNNLPNRNPNERKYPLTWKLRNELQKAISSENYEAAAVLRDKINATGEHL